MTIAPQKLQEFATLFAEFAASYPNSPDGQRHVQGYPECRQQGEANFQAVVAAAGRGEDVTDLVLLKLLPYENTAPNRARGVWTHLAPSVIKDIKNWFEGAGWSKPEDWPKITQAILCFIQRCVADPAQLPAACAEFAALPFVKGFQTGMLTPILNALRPDDFLLVNTKSRRVINYFGGTEFSLGLRDYPRTNAAGKELLAALAAEMKPAEGLNMRPCDLLDMFSHWLVAVKGMPSETGFWKIAPGDDAWQWEECRDRGFIAIGWDDLGDVSALSRAEFNARRDEQLAKHTDWNKNGADQVWKFSRIEDGDRVVANRGTTEVLGIGTVTGPYYFVPRVRHGHRLPVTWDDLTVRGVEEGGWRRTLIELDREDFDAICQAPAVGSEDAADGGAMALAESSLPGKGKEAPLFTAKTFDLLDGLHETPTQDFYAAHKTDFKEHLEEPFRRLVGQVRLKVRSEIRARMETENKVFSRILKNDYGRGGAWEWLWAAFYPKGGERTKDAQLWASLHVGRMEAGFAFGHYSQEKQQTFLSNVRKYRDSIVALLEPQFAPFGLFYGSREELEASTGGPPPATRLADWLAQVENLRPSLRVVWPKEKVVLLSEAGLSDKVAELFDALFPLVLLALDSDPLPAIREYLQNGNGAPVVPAFPPLPPPPPPLPPPPPIQPEYPLATCAVDTGFNVPTLESWVRAVNRKGQAIIYGPPGTGKTFMAEKLAAHLIGGDNGFSDLVQFHPAYAYEDFMQGLRPQTNGTGGLHYPLVPGRFLEFCLRAATRTGPCVLIIDEINRANLARVFGELMFLLEYRKREIPLAGGGTFRIPEHVRLIGTMNTADRSIALVDHALRRRFSFIALYPRCEVLREFHAKHETGFATAGLIEQLKKVNEAIADPHYHLGLSFFLRTDLAAQLADIWQMEIEPYLEEFFFDQPEKFAQFRWDKVRPNVLP